MRVSPENDWEPCAAGNWRLRRNGKRARGTRCHTAAAEPNYHTMTKKSRIVFESKTPESRNAVITQLRQILAHPGWGIIRNELEQMEAASIKAIMGDEIRAGETFHPLEVMRREVAFIRELINMPENIIRGMTPDDHRIMRQHDPEYDDPAPRSPEDDDDPF